MAEDYNKTLVNNYHEKQKISDTATLDYESAHRNAVNNTLNSGGYNDINNPNSSDYSKSAYNSANWSAQDKADVDEKYAAKNVAIAQTNDAKNQMNTSVAASTSYMTPDQQRNYASNMGMTNDDIKEVNPNIDLSNQRKEQQTAIAQSTQSGIVSENTKAINDYDNAITKNNSDISALDNDINNTTDPLVKQNLQKKKADLQTANSDIQKKKSSLVTSNNNVTNVNKSPVVQGNVQVASADKLGTTVNKNTGFETINGGAPFYFQFPTLKSITDFRLKNGFSPYGIRTTTDIARDAVHFKIFESIPGQATAEVVEGTKLVRNYVDSSNIATVGAFTIYPSEQNWLKQNHSHQYGLSPFVQGALGVINTGADFLEGLDTGAKLLQVASKTAAGGNATDTTFGNVAQRKADILKFYQSSADQEMEISFNLFTKSDFLNDVFRPIMFLTALGYPKRLLSGETPQMLQDTVSNIQKMAQQNDNSVFANIWKTITDAGIVNAATGAINNVSALENLIATKYSGIGPFRYYISKRPEFLSVRHASGLFYFPLANIIGFNYEFNGPWYNYSGPALEDSKALESLISNSVKSSVPTGNTFGERVESIFEQFKQDAANLFNGNTGKPANRFSENGNTLLKLADMTSSDFDKNIRNKNGQPYAYPTSAKCSIRIRSAVPFFRDDFMQLYNAAGQGGQSLVTVTQLNTGQTNA